jgi:hypothetical protein
MPALRKMSICCAECSRPEGEEALKSAGIGHFAAPRGHAICLPFQGLLL